MRRPNRITLGHKGEAHVAGSDGHKNRATVTNFKKLSGPIGLIKHGKNLNIPPGTPLTAYVDQDYPLLAAR